MSDIVVSVSNLSFQYEGGNEALKDVNFEIKRGEFFVVMGPNGAGKTTLCFILGGIIPNMYGGIRKGKVNVLGFDPWDHPIYETAKKVGILLQDPESQLVMPSVFAELAFGPANLGVPKEEIFRRIKEAVRIVGLEGFEDRHPRELSGGQKQRAALGAVLTMMPELLVLDEPTSQLDPLGTLEVLAAVRRLKEMGITIIMTTHKTEEIAYLADKVLILNEGEVVAYGYPRDVLSNVELLENVGVKPPAVTTYFYELKKRGIGNIDLPILFEDAVNLAKKMIHDNLLKVNKAEFKKDSQSKGTPIIEIKDVTFTYPGEPPVTALKNINLTIHEGEFIGIVGQNGSGKTTLVKNIVGLLKPSKGKILFKGEDVSKYTVAELSKKIGLILQNPDYQLFTLSCEEEIKFGLKNIGVPEDEIKERIEEALRFVGLEHLRDKYPFALSFGDRRKLAVAAIVAMNPEVIIMDEPTTAQDYKGRYILADLAKKMHDEHGRTIIMITHDMDLVAKYAERLIVMWNGEILADGPTREVFQMHDILEKAFLKPPQITRFAQELKDEGVNPEVLTIEEMIKVLSPAVKEVSM